MRFGVYLEDSNVEVLRLCRILPCHLELLVRRLGMYANMAAHPSDCRFVGAAAPVLLRLDAEATCLAHEAFGMEINEAELPALLVYRDRELVHHALTVRFDDADDVEDFIEAGLS